MADDTFGGTGPDGGPTPEQPQDAQASAPGDETRQVDYLDTGQGAASGGGRRWGPIIGLTVGGLVVAGGAAYGVAQFLGGGASPASAVPDDVFAYLAVDLDPGASQQVEAYRTLKKFPGIKDELHLTGDEDLRRAIFEKIADEADCDLDYDADIDPWLGNAAAMTGWKYKDQPELAVAVAIKDRAAAEKGFETVSACGSDGGGQTVDEAENPGVAFSDDWMVLADDHDVAQAFIDAAGTGSLADNADYRNRVDDVGGEGFVTGYVASGAADELLSTMTTGMDTEASSFSTGSGSGADPLDPAREQMEKYFGDFKGAAMSVRFSDGALEVRAQAEGFPGAALGEGGDSGVEDLPDSSAVAYGVPIGDGYVDSFLDQLRGIMGDETVDQGIEQMEAQSGLQVPEDLDTLLGNGFSIALDSSFDATTVSGDSPQGLSGVPAGIRINGDPDQVAPVLEKVLSLLPLPPDVLHVEQGDDAVALALDSDYASTLADSGDLGDSDGFRRALPDFESGDAGLYVDFNGDWLTHAVEADGAGTDQAEVDDVLANLEPLESFGLTGSSSGDAFEVKLRLTTD